MKSLFSICLVAILFISTTSCDETRQVLNTGSRVELNGSYNVNQLNGNTVSAGQTINFNGLAKTISGNAGCNTYNAPFTIETYQLNIGNVALTRMSCPDMSMENNFLAAVEKVTSYQKTDGTLTLLDANNNVVIKATTGSN
ncbi:Heat shock protein HslJ [Nonlabens sp. Hel1_33_55]|uniref:META domain-containing protein n=1 Tax=Nonlabens sp. Hel1_33_55 TaxID=1336802 RepID=UPI000875E528|nr:META domain-containing protein [Nonlabens sp. Hel1_33_55]SCX90845.1 Heat shock protein HslJ [Nonlabens sp. Hel1_33_55]